MPDISNLRLVLSDDRRTVVYRRRSPNSTLDERVRAHVLGYRTFVADGQIYTDVLVEDTAGIQEFVALQKVTFFKQGADIPSSAVARLPVSVSRDGF